MRSSGHLDHYNSACVTYMPLDSKSKGRVKPMTIYIYSWLVITYSLCRCPCCFGVNTITISMVELLFHRFIASAHTKKKKKKLVKIRRYKSSSITHIEIPFQYFNISYQSKHIFDTSIRTITSAKVHIRILTPSNQPETYVYACHHVFITTGITRFLLTW